MKRRKPLKPHRDAIWDSEAWLWRRPVGGIAIANLLRPGKRSKVRKVSPKRAAEHREYVRVATAYLERRPYCEAMVGHMRIVKSTEIHHKRGRVGKLLTDDTNFLGCCSDCHKWIEENRLAAQERGFSFFRK